ncbi:hypothetical protein DFQ30_004792, partial [Apophysomyces sp. BC1015]
MSIENFENNLNLSPCVDQGTDMEGVIQPSIHPSPLVSYGETASVSDASVSPRSGPTIAQGIFTSKHVDPVQRALRILAKNTEYANELEGQYANAIEQGVCRTVSNDLLRQYKLAEEEVKEFLLLSVKKYSHSKELCELASVHQLDFSCPTNSEGMVSHAGAKPANNVVSSLVPRDLPSLQLAGGSRWNAKKEVYESARAFVRAFAAQLKAYGLSLDEHWERLLVLCLNNSQQIWYDDKLGKRGLSWSEAEAILVAKFDTPIHRCRAMVETFATEQRRGESLAAYVERFQTQRLVSG